MTLSSVSVCLPAFNDEHAIGAVVEGAMAVLTRAGAEHEIIVVNDGSRDRTGAVIDGLAQRHPQVRPLHHVTNQGYGRTMRDAFAAATKELVFYTDGDGQFDIGGLEQLLAMRDQADVINGYRAHRQDPWYRRCIGAVIAVIGRRRFGVPLRDIGCDFRLFPRQWLGRITLTACDGTLGVELAVRLHRAGARFAETPITHHPRRHGRSQFFQWRRLVVTTRELWGLWWLA